MPAEAGAARRALAGLVLCLALTCVAAMSNGVHDGRGELLAVAHSCSDRFVLTRLCAPAELQPASPGRPGHAPKDALVETDASHSAEWLRLHWPTRWTAADRDAQAKNPSAPRLSRAYMTRYGYDDGRDVGFVDARVLQFTKVDKDSVLRCAVLLAAVLPSSGR
jgi:hypothetical protein